MVFCPEAIKLSPVIKKLEEYPKEMEVITVIATQHRQMLDQVLGLFKITPSYDLDIIKDNQTLPRTTVKIIEKFDPVVRKRLDWIVISRGI